MARSLEAPGFTLDQLDGVARGVADVQRATPLVPGDLLLDLDSVAPQLVGERIEVPERDGERDVAGSGRTVRGNGPAGKR
jgi:hypothetical protein